MAQPASYAEAAASLLSPGGLEPHLVRKSKSLSLVLPRQESSSVNPVINPDRLSPRAGDQARHSIDIPPPVPSRPSSRSSSIERGLERAGRILSHRWSTSSLPAEQEPVAEGTYFSPAVKSKKKRRPKNRRRRNSRTRDHGDFIAFGGRYDSSPNNSSHLLLDAVSASDMGRVIELLSSDDLQNEAKSGVLQAAALQGREDILQLLLNSGQFDIDARDDRERTALYAARSRGHHSIEEFLLESNAKPLSREESKIASAELKLWRIHQSEVGDTPSSFPSGRDMIELEDVVVESPVPSSPVQDDHIHKLEVFSFENIQEMIETANKKRFAAQMRGEWVRGPLSTPSIAPGPSRDIPLRQRYARHPGFGFEITVAEFDFGYNGGHRFVVPTPTVDELLYGDLLHKTQRHISSGSSSATARWYHVPANNLGWVEDLIRKIYERRSLVEQRRRDVLLGTEPFQNESQDVTGIGIGPQVRALRPRYRKIILDRDGTQVLSSAYQIFMPYLHWETEKNRAEMNHVMGEIREARRQDIMDSSLQRIPSLKQIQGRHNWSMYEKLFCGYLYHDPPLHPRRTLDQFFYHMIEDTETRDQEQVIPRYYHNIWKRNNLLPDNEEEDKFFFPTTMNTKRWFSLDDPLQPRSQAHMTHSGKIEEKHLIMVDQLWLWVLDENTIISSFPQQWSQDTSDAKDSLDVLESIHRYLTIVNRPPLESIHDFANLIVYNCLAPFARRATPYGSMKVLDVYESAIASVADMETKIFNEFAIHWKKKRKESHSSTLPDHPGKLYNIDREIEQIKEIKDIQDELHILSVLLDNQVAVLKQAALPPDHELQETELPRNAAAAPSISSHGGHDRDHPYVAASAFGKMYFMILEQEKRIAGLQEQARQVNTALTHLLDLKQKQANLSAAQSAISAAQSARWTVEMTEAAQQQGNVMVVFTLVTIVFAPLSLVVTIFQLNLVEFPSTLRLGFVLKYMFGVSVAVIVPLLALMAYSARISIFKVFGLAKLGLANLKWFMRRKRYRRKKWDTMSIEPQQEEKRKPGSVVSV